MKNKAFTLVEILIVVAILGIMAAIVMPTFQGNVAQARESASKSNLGTMRAQIELYRLDHNGIPPGYINASTSDALTVNVQFTGTTRIDGLPSPNTVPSDPFLYGPYLKKIPQNPFNKLTSITVVPVGTQFSAAADGNGGWLYKIETAEIALNWTGTDRDGVAYYDY